MKQLNRLSASASVDQVLQALDDDGAVIIENLLSAELIADINCAIDPLIEQASMKTEINEIVDAFFGDRVRHISGLAAKSSRFAEEVMCHPLLLSVCDQLLLSGCSSYQLNLAHMMDRGPGSEQQMIHRDQDVWVHCCNLKSSAQADSVAPASEIQLASMIALVDFTRANGATCVVPGSHRWDYDRQPNDDELVYVVKILNASNTRTFQIE